MVTIVYEALGPGYTSEPTESARYAIGSRGAVGLMPVGRGGVEAGTTEATWCLVYEEEPMPRDVARIFKTTKGDTSAVTLQIKSNGSAVDLTTLESATLIWRNMATGAIKVNATMDQNDVTSATNGTISWERTATDMDTAAVYSSTMTVTWADGTETTYPNGAHVLVVVEEDV